MNPSFDLKPNLNLSSDHAMKTKSHLTLGLLSSLVLWLLSGHAARATLPEPDNVVYGTITVRSNTITAAYTNFVVEVYRGTNTSNTNYLLSSYRMGADPGFANNYVVNIPLETVDPNSWDTPFVINPVAAETNEAVTLVVKEFKYYRGAPIGSTNHFLYTHLVNSRGFVTNINFGFEKVFPDGYAAWLAKYGLAPGSDNEDADGDGMSNYGEYIAGTNPTNTIDVIRIMISQSGNGAEVSIPTRVADGTGYARMQRLYTLETATNLVETASGTAWVQVPGMIDVLGTNQTIRYTNALPQTNASFYRASIRLVKTP
jgi:hypothetical protein